MSDPDQSRSPVTQQQGAKSQSARTQNAPSSPSASSQQQQEVYQNTNQLSKLTEGTATHQILGNYVIGETVGRGGFGKVKKSVHRVTGEIVAIKILNRTKIQTSKIDMDKKIRREIKILELFSHPNICRLLDVVLDERRYLP